MRCYKKTLLSYLMVQFREISPTKVLISISTTQDTHVFMLLALDGKETLKFEIQVTMKLGSINDLICYFIATQGYDIQICVNLVPYTPWYLVTIVSFDDSCGLGSKTDNRKCVERFVIW